MPRPPSIHLKVLDVHYYSRKLTPTITEGKEYYETSPNHFVSKSSYLNMGYETDFFIVDLLILNKDSVENTILPLEPIVVYPRNGKAKFIPLEELLIGKNLILLLDVLDNAVDFPVVSFFPKSLLLKPKKINTKQLCIQILNFPKSIDRVEIKIRIEDTFGYLHQKTVKLRREKDKDSTIRKSKDLKNIFQSLWASSLTKILKNIFLPREHNDGPTTAIALKANQSRSNEKNSVKPASKSLKHRDTKEGYKKINIILRSCKVRRLGYILENIF